MAIANTTKALSQGIYAPTISFFKPTAEQELDLDVFDQHMEFLARSGCAGVIVQGSTGEAVTLNKEEKATIIRLAKDAFLRVGSPGAIVAGTVGAQSTRETIVMCREAAKAGADFTLILPPSYWPQWMTDDAILGFYTEVADASPLPVIIYSYPGVCSGINMNTEIICELAKHPNIAGVKHTDHDVGKIAREVGITASNDTPFAVLGGATEYLIGAVAVGGHGAISGLANIAPRVCSKAFELAKAGQYAEAQNLQAEMSIAEWGISKGGLLGNKYSVVLANGYPPHAAEARKPLPVVPDHVKEHAKATTAKLIAMERQLEKEGWVGAILRGAQ